MADILVSLYVIHLLEKTKDIQCKATSTTILLGLRIVHNEKSFQGYFFFNVAKENQSELFKKINLLQNSYISSKVNRPLISFAKSGSLFVHLEPRFSVTISVLLIC